MLISGELSARSPARFGRQRSDRLEATRPVRVVLVSGFAMLRRGLAQLLEGAGLRVVGRAADLETALGLVCEHAGSVVVVDTDLACLARHDVVGRLLEHDPTARVVLLSSAAADAKSAATAGARGYVLKTASNEEIVARVRAAALPDELLRFRSAGVRPLEATGGEGRPSATARLSRREVEVLRLLAQGKGNGEIAADLFISPSTAKSHVSQILRKVCAQNRIQAAVYAVRSGLV